MRNVLIIARLETRLTFCSPSPLLLTVVIPILVIGFVSGGQIGGPGRTVPGLLTLFGLFGVTIVGLAFFRDHGWNTWGRLRASSMRPIEILIGKALPLLALFVIQQAVLLAVGWLLLGMPWSGEVGATGALVLAVVSVNSSLGMLVVSCCRNVEDLTVIGYLGGILLAGLGGALTPRDRLPGWMAAVSPVTPAYWMQTGFHSVLTGDHAGGNPAASIAVLFAFAAATGGIAVRVYRFDAAKGYFG